MAYCRKFECREKAKLLDHIKHGQRWAFDEIERHFALALINWCLEHGMTTDELVKLTTQSRADAMAEIQSKLNESQPARGGEEKE